MELRFNGDTAEAIIKQGGEARYIFKIDNKEAHNTLVLEEQCRELFGIVTPFGIYRSIRGQFGVANVAKTYIKAMMMSIGHLRGRGVYFYADDIVIFAGNFETGLELLDETLKCLRRDGFVVSASKCQFFKNEAEVLGQIVGNGEVRIAPTKVEAINALNTPSTKK